MEASTQYCSAPGADMDRRVVIDIFFVLPMDGLLKSVIYHGSQHNIVCNHYLREYPVVISGILSKEKVRIVRYFSSVLFNFNRNAKGLRRHYPLRVFSVDKKRARLICLSY
jgi:hypothetical protein